MKFNPIVIKYLSDRCGCDVTTAAGATVLAHDIEAKTGERLTANTLKRLVGVLPYAFTPRTATLDILAKYLGYSSWQIFSDYLDDSISFYDGQSPSIDIHSLRRGTVITFKWEPDRNIKLRHLGDGCFEIIAIANSKLQIGDILILSQLGEGYPLIAKQVIRDSRNLGGYIAAKHTGINSLTVL